jgi:hypothetical protein
VVVSAPGREPQFSIQLYVPGEPPRDRRVAVGDVVFGDWNLAEYNPARQAVTLKNNGEIKILPRGERVTLEILP